jgi:AbiV family abortive infection protein
MLAAHTLHQGAWYALEQAGRLFYAAAVLADDGDPITGAAVAMFGREELGRSRILQELANRVDAGDSVEAADVHEACDNHVSKQSAGAFSITLRAEPPTGVDAALQGMLSAEPGSREWRAAKGTADLATHAKRKRNPQQRHLIRIRGLYVDMNESGSGWLRPSARDSSEAINEIVDGVNDYAAERDRLRDEVLEEDNPGMARARLTMSLKITLPEPRWPKNLSVMSDRQDR